MNDLKKDIVILGGGLAGLTAGYVLANSRRTVSVFEHDAVVGGLSKTIEKNGFRFDLGGHRFFTRDERINAFIRELMGHELLSVRRSSKIYMRGKYFDYPLRPLNAMFGLGITTTARILADYGVEKARRAIKKTEVRSLEDWVVGNFGRTMFNIYFKEYSEKVWGLDCGRISATWVAQRIKGLSLAKAVKSAFIKASGRDCNTLTDLFWYPALGIGRISDRLRDGIEKCGNGVFTGTAVTSIHHADRRIRSVTVRSHGREWSIPAGDFISSIPLTKFVGMLDPAPPPAVIETAAQLGFRDLVVAAIMVDRERVTDETWIYIPERKIPFGRIHEPTNWSPAMAPAGKTLLVVEYFSSRGDSVWNMPDDRLADLTVEHLARLGFIARQEVLDRVIVRVPKAYPLFEIGYRERVDALHDYLAGFKNLHVAGRSGMFRYYNMDVAIQSGMETAERVLSQADSAAVERGEMALAGA